MTASRTLKIRADERGAAIIELALVAPILALMTIGIVDMSNAYSRKLALEQGAQRAIEKIMQTTQQDTVEGTLTTEAVCQVNGLNADGTCKTSPISASNVTVTWRVDCTDPTSGSMISQVLTTSAAADAVVCGATQKTARYIQIALTDQYYPLFPIHFAEFTSSDGSYHLAAAAGMRIE